LESRRGKRKEPYATRGLLGWTICGPFSPTSRENDVSINFVDLHEQVEQLFKQDFTDHHMQKPASSVEDEMAMTTHLTENGHYEVDPIQAGFLKNAKHIFSSIYELSEFF
jgi:hypothetical protein